MTRPRWVAIAVCVACLPLGAAGAQENRQCSPEDIRVRLRLRDTTWNQGERVSMRIVAKNTSEQACEMQFPSGRGGTVRIFRGDARVWEHGYCKVYTDHLEIQTWAPGRTESWRYGWNQNEYARTESGRFDCKGQRTPAESGRY